MDGETLTLLKPHRFTVADYHAMAEAGVLGPDSRVELIEGRIVDMSPIGSPHFRTVTRLTMLIVPLVRDRADVSVQGPVRLNDYSEPQPDLVVMRRDATVGEDLPCYPADVLLLIEVADSSLVNDQRVKAPLYAESHIAEYWLVNLPDRAVEVHRDPAEGRYRDVRSGTLDILSLPGIAIEIDAILPPRK